MSHLRYAQVRALAVMLGVTTASACSGKPLRLAINSLAVASAPIFVAEATGAFDSLFRVELIPFASGRFALDALVKGDAELATVAETPIVLQTGARGSAGATDSLVIVATMTVSEFRIIANRSRGIDSFGKLAHRKIGVLKGTSAEFFLVAMLTKHGIALDSVEVVNLQPVDVAAALRHGDIDAASIWEPHAERAVNALGAAAISFEDTELYLEHFTLVTRASVLRSRGPDISRLVRVIRTVDSVITDRPSLGIQIVAQRLGMAEPELQGIWPRFSFPKDTVPSLLKQMEAVENWAARIAGRVPRSSSSLSSLIHEEPVRTSP